MSSSIEAELLDPDMALEYDLHESDFGDDGLDDEEQEDEEEEEEEEEEGPLISSRKDGDMIESYDRRELISNEANPFAEHSEEMEFKTEDSKVEMKSMAEPYQGLEFVSEEAARAFYYAYAKATGFTVRISKCRRARDGSIVCRRFVCSKEGFYVRKFGRTKRSRALTRVGCLARLVVKKLDSGSWVVASFEREHNHPPFVQGAELNYEPPGSGRRPGRAAGSPATGSKLDGGEPGHPAASWRFSRLQQEGMKLAEEGSSSAEVFDVAMAAIKEAAQKVMAAKRASQSWGSSGEVSSQKVTIEENGGRRRKVQVGGDGDPDAAREQEWDALAGSSSTGLSEAQVAALQAVAEAFNVPTLSGTPSSVPMKGMVVTGEGDGGRRLGDLHETPRMSGPNPLVHAAAIAAGARIASPEVAATLIRAVQSRTTVHIRTAGGGGAAAQFPKQPPPSQLQHANSHYVLGGESALGELTTRGELQQQLAAKGGINSRAMAELEAAAAVAAHNSLMQQHAGSTVV
ncbi:uncharacterized protein LOC144707644 [Wolffia australiana]